MVIDDSPEFSETVKLVLSLDPRFSDNVHLAESGEQGLEQGLEAAQRVGIEPLPRRGEGAAPQPAMQPVGGTA